MLAAYTLASVTRLYEAALARHDLRDVGRAQSFEVLVRAEALRLERAAAAAAPTDRYGLLHDLGVPGLINAYQGAESIYARGGMTVPEPSAFAKAGVQWEALASSYRALAMRSADPDLVVAPVLPLDAATVGGVAASWREFYAVLTSDHSIANNPLRARPDGHGLQFGSALRSDGAVSNLHAQEISSARSNYHSVEDDRGVRWTVAVVSLNDAAAPTNTPYLADAENHISPSEYLAVQARRIIEQKTPLDVHTWTWLRGVIGSESGEHALAGVWVPGYGQIRLYANPVGYAQERLLARAMSRG